MASIPAGSFDRRITLQKRMVEQTLSGQATEVWCTVGTRYAALRPMTVAERFSTPQWVAREQVQFETRYSDAAAALTPLDRIVYPPLAEGASPDDAPQDRNVYDIMGVLEVGRREGLRIMTARRPDVTP